SPNDQGRSGVTPLRPWSFGLRLVGHWKLGITSSRPAPPTPPAPPASGSATGRAAPAAASPRPAARPPAPPPAAASPAAARPARSTAATPAKYAAAFDDPSDSSPLLNRAVETSSTTSGLTRPSVVGPTADARLVSPTVMTPGWSAGG